MALALASALGLALALLFGCALALPSAVDFVLLLGLGAGPLTPCPMALVLPSSWFPCDGVLGLAVSPSAVAAAASSASSDHSSLLLPSLRLRVRFALAPRPLGLVLFFLARESVPPRPVVPSSW